MADRPRYLNLWAFHFPINALLSILHRVSGVFLTVFLLAGLGILNIWLIFPQHFEAVLQFWQGFGGKLLFWSGLSALGFHWLAGVRHLFMSHDVWQIQTNRQRNALSAKILIMLFIFWLLFISAEIWL